MVAQIEGVDESNKDAICSSFGNALSGAVTHCSLDGPSTTRRHLNAVPLFMDITVSDLQASQIAVEASDFTASLPGLPVDVTVTSVDISGNIHFESSTFFDQLVFMLTSLNISTPENLCDEYYHCEK